MTYGSSHLKSLFISRIQLRHAINRQKKNIGRKIAIKHKAKIPCGKSNPQSMRKVLKIFRVAKRCIDIGIHQRMETH